MTYIKESKDTLIQIINTVNENKGLSTFLKIEPQMDLRNDLGFDSLDLAELTVRIEKEFGVDIFEDGIIKTVKEILDQLPDE